MTESMPVSHQIALLINEAVTVDGHPASRAEVARAIGLSHQGLSNLLNGNSQYPRLHTLRALCRLYGLSLDYFTCTSMAECRAYLLQQRRAAQGLIDTIANQADQLSPWGQRQVLVLMTWIQSGKQAYLSQQGRKSK